MHVIIYHLLYTVKNVRQSLPYLLGNIERSGVKSLMRKVVPLLEEIGNHIVAKRKSFFKDLFKFFTFFSTVCSVHVLVSFGLLVGRSNQKPYSGIFVS